MAVDSFWAHGSTIETAGLRQDQPRSYNQSPPWPPTGSVCTIVDVKATRDLIVYVTVMVDFVASRFTGCIVTPRLYDNMSTAQPEDMYSNPTTAIPPDRRPSSSATARVAWQHRLQFTRQSSPLRPAPP